MMHQEIRLKIPDFIFFFLRPDSVHDIRLLSLLKGKSFSNPIMNNLLVPSLSDSSDVLSSFIAFVGTIKFLLRLERFLELADMVRVVLFGVSMIVLLKCEGVV